MSSPIFIAVKAGQSALFWAMRAAIIIPMLLAFWGRPVSAQEPTSQKQSMEIFHRILILPVYDMSAIYGENVSSQGPLSGQVFITEIVAPEATGLIGAKLSHLLARIDAIQATGATGYDPNAMIGIAPVAGQRDERIAAIQKFGRQKGVDGVFCVYLFGFRKRVGAAYGVDQPAMVAFELNLVSVATGRLVWQGHFSETQKTLSENVLKIGQFIKRKGRWITAEEMADKALADLVHSFEKDFLKQ